MWIVFWACVFAWQLFGVGTLFYFDGDRIMRMSIVGMSVNILVASI